MFGDKRHLKLAVRFVLLRLLPALGLVLTIGPGLWWLSERFNTLPVRMLSPDATGAAVSVGVYTFPTGIIFFSFLLLLGFLSSLVFIYVNARAAAKSDPNYLLIKKMESLQRDYDAMIDKARLLVRTVYDHSSKPRINVKSIEGTYRIQVSGDTIAERTALIECGPRPAHFWEFWIDADEEADALPSVRDVRFTVKDADSGQELDAIPIENRTRSKRFAIFFPEMAPSDQKRITISFQWPGYWRKLITKGSSEYFWSYRSDDGRNRTSVKYVWNFEPGCKPIKCRLHEGNGGRLTTRYIGESYCVTYEDEREPSDGNRRSVRFELT